MLLQNCVSVDEQLLATTIEELQLSVFPLTINRVCELAYQYAKVNNLNPGFSLQRKEELDTSGSRASLNEIHQS